MKYILNFHPGDLWALALFLGPLLLFILIIVAALFALDRWVDQEIDRERTAMRKPSEQEWHGHE